MHVSDIAEKDDPANSRYARSKPQQPADRDSMVKKARSDGKLVLCGDGAVLLGWTAWRNGGGLVVSLAESHTTDLAPQC